MKSIIIIMALQIGMACGPTVATHAQSQPPSHALYDDLLGKYVNQQGNVDYEGLLQAQDQLDTYLALLSKNAPNEGWTENEQLAYWINVYNAFTLDLILEYYPVESIKDIGASIQIPFINTPWDIKFIEIGEETYDLNNIEHGIIRKEFDEPRIHFALVCAAESCPRLRNEAYQAEQLDAQLTEAARDFLSDSAKNEIINNKEARLSKLFSWYSGDFKKETDLIGYINQYSGIQLDPGAKISFKTYSWKLNDQKNSR
jgi:hypothetical protein